MSGQAGGVAPSIAASVTLQVPRGAVRAIGLLSAALVVWLALGAQVQAQVFLPGTQPAGEDGGIGTPLQSSLSCKRCHGGYDPDDDYEPWDSWRASMMGNATRDPVYRAALAIAEQDHPDAGDFCIRCHSMPAWLRGRSMLPDYSEADGERFLADEAGTPSDDLDGVACQVCHRMDEAPEADANAPYDMNAQIFFIDGDRANTRLGPYADVPGAVQPTHNIEQSAFVGSSQLCAQCHDITNPILNGRELDGTDTGLPFNIERTYSEWLYSDFSGPNGKSCLDCHMKLTEVPRQAAKDGPLREYNRRHDLAGSNYWVPKAIGEAIPSGREDWKPLYEASAERAAEMLRSAATVEVLDLKMGGDTISASVRVTNESGHKLPSGYPEGRRMWLEVAVVDVNGDVVNGSGLYDDATYELSRDEQLRTYEVKLGEGGEPSFHFALNDTILTDTRLLPKGFVDQPGLGMTPQGRDYTDANGDFVHYDEAAYDFPSCGPTGLSLRVRLRFQTTTKEYIEFLRDQTPDTLTADGSMNWGQVSYDAWLKHGGNVPLDMVEVVQPIGVPKADCDGGPVDASGGFYGDDGGGPAPGVGATMSMAGSCGCRVTGAPSRSDRGYLAVLSMLAVALIYRRRRR